MGIEAKSLSTSKLIMDNRLAKGYQRLVETPANICNGRNGVTSTCPFTVGTGMNNLFKGNQIVEFQFNENRHLCMTMSNLLPLVQISNCGENGTYWIVVGNYSGGYENVIINRYASNLEGMPEFLTGGNEVNSGVTVTYLANHFQKDESDTDWSYSGN